MCPRALCLQTVDLQYDLWFLTKKVSRESQKNANGEINDGARAPVTLALSKTGATRMTTATRSSSVVPRKDSKHLRCPRALYLQTVDLQYDMWFLTKKVSHESHKNANGEINDGACAGNISSE